MKLVLLVIASLAISACSSVPGRSGGANTATQNGTEPLEQLGAANLEDDLIVQNLIYTLAQLPALYPFSTTVQVKNPTSEMALSVAQRLNDAGYGVQYVDSDEGLYYVRHSASSSISDNGKKITYSVSIGDISAERDYISEKGATAPDSEMRIVGAEEVDIQLNDDVFGINYAQTQYKEVYFDTTDLPVVVNYDTLDGEGYTANAAALTTEKPASFKARVQENVFDIMRSNYADIFTTYTDVSQTTLIFPNDSLRLGDENKSTVQEYVSNFDPETDVISVVGCSHGKTKIKEGNALLALGRANRVKEAFIFAGLEHSSIFEEGCWDAEHFDEVMPRRGVVLTHKRRVNAG